LGRLCPRTFFHAEVHAAGKAACADVWVSITFSGFPNP
jgi:hypothetical protein